MAKLRSPGWRVPMLSLPRSVTSLLLACLLGGSAGCGYTLVGTPSQASGTPVTLAVVTFVNRTREPVLAGQLTAALRNTLVRHQTFRLTSMALAQQHLHGVVSQFRTYPVAFDADDNALQYRLEADILIRLIDTASEQTLLEQSITAWAEYLTSGNRDVREEVVAREAAINLLARRFAWQCHDLLTLARLSTIPDVVQAPQTG